MFAEGSPRLNMLWEVTKVLRSHRSVKHTVLYAIRSRNTAWSYSKGRVCYCRGSFLCKMYSHTKCAADLKPSKWQVTAFRRFYTVNTSKSRVCWLATYNKLWLKDLNSHVTVNHLDKVSCQIVKEFSAILRWKNIFETETFKQFCDEVGCWAVTHLFLQGLSLWRMLLLSPIMKTLTCYQWTS